SSSSISFPIIVNAPDEPSEDVLSSSSASKGVSSRGGLQLHSSHRENHQNERFDMLAWLWSRQKALGVTALCLSGGGSLGMIHIGLIRFLLQCERDQKHVFELEQELRMAGEAE
ncbi:unnamed protein product, partial [Amoebophrya sp. A25]